MSTPEGLIKSDIKKLLDKYKIFPASKAGNFPGVALGWYFMPSQNGFGVKGVPDFVGHYHRLGHVFGTAFYVEAKAPGKRPTGFQALQIEAIASSGGAVFVVDGPESLGVFEEWLKAH